MALEGEEEGGEGERERETKERVQAAAEDSPPGAGGPTSAMSRDSTAADDATDHEAIAEPDLELK